MSRGLGRVQRRVLEIVNQAGRSVGLWELGMEVTGLDMEDYRGPREPPQAVYKAVARAVAGLRRRGLVWTEHRTNLAESGWFLSVESTAKLPRNQHL